MKKYNVGIIGYGWVSSAHIPAINGIAQAQVTAVYSSRPQDPVMLSARHGGRIACYSNLAEILANPEINVVSICSYPHLHAEHIVAAAKAGKHLIIEKPITLSLADAHRVAAAVKAAGVRTCVCFEARFSSQFLAIKGVIDAGLLGALHYGEIDYQGAGNALKQIESLPFRPGEGDDWLRVGPLKIRIDGGLLYGTAYLREPFLAEGSARYYDLGGGTNRGELMTPADEVTAIIRAGHRAGWQMSAHVAGDAGVDVVLDALEAANRDRPIAPRRFNLIHAYLPNAETARRAAALGAVVDTQPVMYYKDGDALRETLGEARAARMYGLREWAQAGVKVSINADHMMGLDPDQSLQPYNPLLALYIAVSRKTESGRVHGADQKVSRQQALRMVTADAAYLSFDEKNRGSIEVGKLADLAILSDHFLTCPEEQIRRIKVVTTILDGQVVYERK